ncbi:hypothetical protein RF11_09537 [Thelohanellus kitauei]|uniref:Uncharacterized protein n=1 Tax=Thelohanellus kitauei TaxID=669202 RepID=A0A0C2M835_THEKT|nr:hypothetical protein RF11_09537 [Thelohanellus kitauei]
MKVHAFSLMCSCLDQLIQGGEIEISTDFSFSVFWTDLKYNVENAIFNKVFDTEPFTVLTLMYLIQSWHHVLLSGVFCLFSRNPEVLQSFVQIFFSCSSLLCRKKFCRNLHALSLYGR